MDLAKSHDGLSVVLAGMGQFVPALDARRQGIALLESLLKGSPADRDLKYQLAVSQANLAFNVARSSVEEAENIYGNVASRTAELVAADPSNSEYRVLRGDVLSKQSWNLQFLGRAPESEAILRQAVAIDEELVRDFPQVPGYQDQLASAFAALASVLSKLAKLDESAQVQRQSMAILEKLAAEYPKVPNYRSRLGGDLNNLAIMLIDQGNVEEARQLLEQAVVHQTAALEMNPDQNSYVKKMSSHLSLLTEVQLALGDQAGAARAAETFAHHVLTRGGSAGDTMLNIENGLRHRALEEISAANRQPDENMKMAQEFVSSARVLETRAIVQAAAQEFQNDSDQHYLVYFLTTAPEPYRDADLAVKMARRAVELKPDDPECLQALSWALYRSGDFQGAIEFDRKAGTKDSFIQAMAHWQLGEKSEARTSFDGACAELQRYEQESEAASQQGQISVPLLTQYNRLQAEAAALLGVTIPGAETSPEPAAKVEEAMEQPPSTPTSKTPNTEEPPK